MRRRILAAFGLTLSSGWLGTSCGGESFESGDSGEHRGGAGGVAASGAMSGSSSGTAGTGGAAGTNGGGTAGTVAGTGGTSRGGSGGDAGATSGTSGAGGTSSGGSATGGDAGAGAAGQASFCALEPDAGPCLALMTRFAFNAATGVCHPFTYGGCDGNANNFASAESCYTACGGLGELDPGACEYPTDCVLVPARCCGVCGQAELSNTVAVNRAHVDVLPDALGCHLIDCVTCEPTPNPWLGATCRAGRCVAFDVRQTDLTECSSSDDCRLRAGLACCEECNVARESFVGINAEADVRGWVCGNAPVVCAGCVPAIPPNLYATCGDGRCGVRDTELPE